MKTNDTQNKCLFSHMFILTFGDIDFAFQEVYDWLGADFKIPLFFILVHQATNNMVHAKQKVETQRHKYKHTTYACQLYVYALTVLLSQSTPSVK